MYPERNLFDGSRSSDLRFDNLHILAEYIARAQRVVDSAKQIQESSEQLVQVAMKSAENCVKSVQAVQRQMKVDFDALLEQVTRSAKDAGNNAAKVVAGAHAYGGDYLSAMGEAVRMRHSMLEDRASEIVQTAARLEKSVARAEECRKQAQDELEQLRRFKIELTRYEQASLKRVSDAEQKLYGGLSLTDRIWLVFFPRATEVKIGKPPVRPTSTFELAGLASERSVRTASGGAGDAASVGGALRK